MSPNALLRVTILVQYETATWFGTVTMSLLSIVAITVVVVTIGLVLSTLAGFEADTLEIEDRTVLVFVHRSRIVADDAAGFEVAAAMEAACEQRAAAAVIDGGLR